MLSVETVENYSGYNINLFKYVKPLRKGYYYVRDITVSGDAPKNFISKYNYEKGVRKSSLKSWPHFIAKVGHKWYPVESITEYLLNKIGEQFNLNMAVSELRMSGIQLRFLSKFFLKKGESLVHGAEIFAGYLEDKDFVEEVENKGLAREFYTFEFVKEALVFNFGENSEHILVDFVKMLVFDAIVGNNDRHFYNWGIIVDVEKKKKPTFAPIFDTARGLYWNNKEEFIKESLKDKKTIEAKIKKYTVNSKPKTGWDGIEDINHFKLIEKIYLSDFRYKKIIEEMIDDRYLSKTLQLIDADFVNLLSEERREIIKRCLLKRWETIKKIINSN